MKDVTTQKLLGLGLALAAFTLSATVLKEHGAWLTHFATFTLGVVGIQLGAKGGPQS